MRWLDDIFDSMDMRLGELWELVMNRKAWRAAVHGVSKTELNFESLKTLRKNFMKLNISQNINTESQ